MKLDKFPEHGSVAVFSNKCTEERADIVAEALGLDYMFSGSLDKDKMIIINVDEVSTITRYQHAKLNDRYGFPAGISWS